VTTGTSSYSLLKRLTLAFSTVAILVFALTGAFLYNALSTELQRRDDIEISGKLSQFLQLARDTGSAQAMRNKPSVFHEVLISHPGVYLAIFDRQGAVLLQHSDRPSVDLAATPATQLPNAPYTCEPAGIGPSRCVFADETLPSGDSVRVLRALGAKLHG
jgi:two-component system heavy metal sensor histidine kinase CusS